MDLVDVVEPYQLSDHKAIVAGPQTIRGILQYAKTFGKKRVFRLKAYKSNLASQDQREEPLRVSQGEHPGEAERVEKDATLLLVKLVYVSIGGNNEVFDADHKEEE
eukprot:CAMPEP_0116924682 /NCGR_PEP_ID=MMETSP0467-20121206/23661_1 /TAXON_ID=283647 /ORGANISM="Mesodinium pulex, Strain SPMC105" /LENGTH=105 /DNA_ID=CAMNT_0004603567 /DNA_START=246 /DNA_END=562 /DNA_ORIENTATION=+